MEIEIVRFVIMQQVDTVCLCLNGKTYFFAERGTPINIIIKFVYFRLTYANREFYFNKSRECHL